MTEAISCPACGTGNPASARFCAACGEKLATGCPRCGADLPPGAAFCPSCGLALAPGREPEEEERKIVSVLFVDLVGFTSRSERSDPEDVRAMLRPYYGRVREEIERLGGSVEKFIGDAVVGLFGAPVAREDDPERAVRAALNVTRAIEELNASNPGLDLAVRAAVNTGEAVVSIGTPIEGEGVVIGDTVNTASRLQSVAPEGGVVVGEVTYRATRHAIDYQAMEPVMVKGKAEPVRLWLAAGLRTAIGADRERPDAASLVGRDEEIALLKRLWEGAATASRPHLVSLIGPPGIGKSRLVRELASRVGDSARVLKGRCSPFGETSGFGAFAQQVRAAAEIRETETVAEAGTTLRAFVESLFEGSEADQVSEHLAILLGLSSEGSPDKQVLFYTARRFVEALATARPTVLIFEDIHWAEPSLLDLIESLAARIRDVAVLLLTLARPDLLDGRPTWGGGLTGYTAVPVEPLPDAEARRLALELLATRPEAEGAIERLIHTGGGNPLFLEELAASLAEHAATLTTGLPTSVQAIIAARLDALPGEERRLLQDASVMGRSFWRGALLAIAGDGSTPDRVLDSLEVRDFIRRQPISQVAGDREFTFKHVLIREVAYGTLPRAARRTRHAAVARYLEETLGDRTRESASVLAHHWREAGDKARASEYLMTAAEVASRAWAKDQAIALYSEAIALLEEIGPEDRLDEAQLARAWARLDASDLVTALAEDVEPLLARAEGRTRLQALMARVRLAYWAADAESMRVFGDQTISLARELGDPGLEARALATMAETAGMAGDPARAIELGTKALSSWPDSPDGEYAHSLGILAIDHYWRGEYEQAYRLALESFEIGTEASHVNATLQAAEHVGLALAGLSRHEEAFDWFQRAVMMGRERELVPRMTARALNMWAGALREVGDLQTARELSEEALEAAAVARFPGAEVSARIDLLFTDLAEAATGPAGQAIPGLAEAVAGTKGWHQWLFSGRLAQARADLALDEGRYEEAVTLARASLQEALQPRRLKYSCQAGAALARAQLGVGRPDEAEASARQAVADAERLGHAPSLWLALGTLAEVLARSGRDDAAAQVTGRVRSVVDGFAASLAEPRRRLLLSHPPLAALLSPA
jgi:class 3 adenylate cyclase/tetratricopeptide (TPR) repeat protein